MLSFMHETTIINVHELIYQLVIATIAGGIIGTERELKKKGAGLKTFILICCGSAIYTIISLSLGEDKTRIAAQVVSGVGFIGAGTIFRSNDKVEGITTAAFIWVTSSIGMLIGIGLKHSAILISLGLVLCIYILSLVESRIRRKFDTKTPTNEQ